MGVEVAGVGVVVAPGFEGDVGEVVGGGPGFGGGDEGAAYAFVFVFLGDYQLANVGMVGACEVFGTSYGYEADGVLVGVAGYVDGLIGADVFDGGFDPVEGCG